MYLFLLPDKEYNNRAKKIIGIIILKKLLYLIENIYLSRPQIIKYL